MWSITWHMFAHYLAHAAHYLNQQIFIVISMSTDFLSVVSIKKCLSKKCCIEKSIIKKFLIKKIIMKKYIIKNFLKKSYKKYYKNSVIKKITHSFVIVHENPRSKCKRLFQPWKETLPNISSARGTYMYSMDAHELG